MRFVWVVLGSMALEGPVVEWVAYHRRHHRFSDSLCHWDVVRISPERLAAKALVS